MFNPIVFNEETCNACNLCVDMCNLDVLAVHPEKGKPPLVVYPEECEYCGSCWAHCPHRDKGAIKVIIPLPMRSSILRG